jgi:hypothetical protein
MSTTGPRLRRPPDRRGPGAYYAVADSCRIRLRDLTDVVTDTMKLPRRRLRTGLAGRAVYRSSPRGLAGDLVPGGRNVTKMPPNTPATLRDGAAGRAWT